MKNKEEETNIIKIISTALVWFIIFIISIIIIMISKVNAEIYAATSQYIGMPICQGNNDYISVSCSGAYNRYWGSYRDTNLLSEGKTTYIELRLILVGININSVPSVSTYLQAYNNSTGNYVTATPDRNEIKKVGPWNDGAGTYFTWSFELDSTINSNELVFTIVLNNGTFRTMYEAEANISKTTGDNDDVIASINKQTEIINENNNKNTDRIIQNMLPNIEGINSNLKGTKEVETSKSNQTNTQMTTTESTEEGYINNFKGQNVNYNINYNENSYNLLWYIINRIRTIHESITILITSCLVILLVSQIFRRNKI